MFIPGFVVEKIELSLYRVVNVNTERERESVVAETMSIFHTLEDTRYRSKIRACNDSPRRVEAVGRKWEKNEGEEV